MSEQYKEALSPVWPELAEVISESPARVLLADYYIAKIGTSADADGALMVFQDDVETTAVVPESDLPRMATLERRGPYKAIKFVLGRPFSAPGFLASAALAIARSKVNQLIYSTYSFDYILVMATDLQSAVSGLERMGFAVSFDT